MDDSEYLAFERASEMKHELFDGEIFAMSGASREHNLIVANLIYLLGGELRRRPCEHYPPEMRVKSAPGRYVYPDVSALCVEPRFEDDQFDTLLNPQLVIEVLSDSTEKYDRGKKFDAYRSIASLKDYVLVSQSEVLVEHFSRRDDGSWLLHVLREGDRLELPGVGCAIDLNEIYLKVFAEKSATNEV